MARARDVISRARARGARLTRRCAIDRARRDSGVTTSGRGVASVGAHLAGAGVGARLRVTAASHGGWSSWRAA